VHVLPGAMVRRSVVLADTWIGPGALVDTSIVDSGVVIGSGAVVGHGDDHTPNVTQPKWLDTGITVIGERSRIPAGARLGRNVMVQPGRSEDDFASLVVPSGGTV
jgi:glucose-1-phosphate adenylyltransferase